MAGPCALRMPLCKSDSAARVNSSTTPNQPAAHRGDGPPAAAAEATGGSQDNDRAAWGCYGAIVFWMTRPSVTTAEVKDKVAPYWQRLNSTLLPAASDPLIRLRNVTLPRPGERVPVIQPILAAFPDEIRPILEWGLQHRTALTSLFAATLYDAPSSISSACLPL